MASRIREMFSSKEDPIPRVNYTQPPLRPVVDSRMSNHYGSKQLHPHGPLPVVELRVPMCCEKCKEKVQEELEDLEGVRTVVCDQFHQRVTVAGYVDPLKVLKKVKKVKKKSEFFTQGSYINKTAQVPIVQPHRDAGPYTGQNSVRHDSVRHTGQPLTMHQDSVRHIGQPSLHPVSAGYAGQPSEHRDSVRYADQVSGHRDSVRYAGQAPGHGGSAGYAGQPSGHRDSVRYADQVSGHRDSVRYAGQAPGHGGSVQYADQVSGHRDSVRFADQVSGHGGSVRYAGQAPVHGGSVRYAEQPMVHNGPGLTRTNSFERGLSRQPSFGKVTHYDDGLRHHDFESRDLQRDHYYGVRRMPSFKKHRYHDAEYVSMGDEFMPQYGETHYARSERPTLQTQVSFSKLPVRNPQYVKPVYHEY